MRKLSLALAALSLSLSAVAAPIKASKAQCEALSLPFVMPPAEAMEGWGDADYQEWLDSRAAIYCARHSATAWCACYASGAFDL